MNPKRTRKMIFELCAETIDACLAAKEGGADRLELCSGLSEGGVTPSHGLIRAAIERSGLPVHVLIRPRGGDFFYSEAEVAVMREDILHSQRLGAAGVVLGLLRPDRTVDIEATRALVQLAHPMKVTFHRAFDATLFLPQALEDVITTGADRVLTSGGQKDVVAGATALSALVLQANHRIDVAVGGGLRLQNAASLAQRTGATHFHGSLRRKLSNPDPAAEPIDESSQTSVDSVVDVESIRAMIHCLKTVSA
jgi:copper homeostasis protein